MKKILLFALPLAMLSLPAGAQMKSVGQAPNTVPMQSSGKPQTTTPMEGELSRQPDMATTQATGDANIGKLSDMMAKGDAMAKKIQTISAVGSIKVVQADSMGASAEDLQSAYNANMVPISALQASIAANSALNAKVAAQKIEPMQIVAAEIEADGSVTIYVRNKTS